MGDLIQFRPREQQIGAPDPKCKTCKGRGWIAREEGVSQAVPSIIICDCMKGKD